MLSSSGSISISEIRTEVISHFNQFSTGQLTATNITSGDLRATNATVSQLTATNITTGDLIASGSVKATGMTVSTLLASTSISTGLLNATSLTAGDIVGTNLSSGSLAATNINTTELTAANLNATGITVSTLLASTSISTGLLNATSLTATNAVSTNLSSGSINATGMTSGGHVIPSSDITYDLGSADKRWRDIYLSGNTIDLGGLKISNSGGNVIQVKNTAGELKSFEANQFIITSDTNEKFTLKVSSGSLQLFNSAGTVSYIGGSAGSVASTSGGTSVDLSSIGSNIIPSANATYDLGSVNNRFRNLYLGGNVISFGNGLQIDSFNWSYISNYVIPSYSTTVDNSILFKGAAQEHSAYIRDGEVYTFGRNNFGQLGQGDTIDRTLPTKVRGISGATAIACGESFTVVMLGNGTLVSFGLNTNGQLGDGTTTTALSQVAVAGITTAIDVACGNNYTVIVLADGTVRGFGNNSIGQLGAGNGSTNVTNTSAVSMIMPAVPNGETAANYYARFIVCGLYHTVVLLENGSVYVCGDNTYAQLGEDPTVLPNSNSLGIVSTVSNVVSAECGHSHTILITYLGNVITFGRNEAGQLGQGTIGGYNSIPTTIVTQATAGSLGLSTSVAAGFQHTVIVKGDNTISVCGSNSRGQLGLGTTVTQASTLTTLAGYQGVSAAGGKNHTIIKTLANVYTYTGTTSQLVAFGDNTYGQMGDSSPNISARYFPNRISDNRIDKILLGTGVNAGVSGYIDTDGTVYVTGYNGNSGLADYSTTDVRKFKPISYFSKRILKANVEISSIFLDSSNQVYTLGLNQYGQLGNNTTVDSRIPINISSFGSLSGKSIIDVVTNNSSSYALDSTGVLHSWGLNASGQLGRNNTVQSNIPLNMSGFGSLSGRTILKIAKGNRHAVALDSTGTVHAWGGSGNPAVSSALGNNSTVQSNTPINISSFGSLSGKSITAISSCDAHTLAIDSTGAVHAWGLNTAGQLGNNSTVQINVPVNVSSFGSLSGKSIVAIGAGLSYSVALDSNGEVHTWGTGSNGRLGNNTTVQSNIPINISTFGSLSGKIISKISSSAYSTIVLDSEGNFHVWGQNVHGEFGDGTTTRSLIPKIILATDTIRTSYTTKLSSGTGDHKILANTNYTASPLVMGSNTNRQIGDNTVLDRYTPVAVGTGTLGSTLVSVANSLYHSAAVLANGTVYTWGRNDYGQCGTSNAGADVGTPVQVAGITNAVDVTCGVDFTLVRNSDSSVYAFGRNNMGQLGISTTTLATNTSTPSFITTLSAISDVKASGNGRSAMAYNNNGLGYAWGDNAYGQLGLSSSSAFIDTPTAIDTVNLQSAKITNMCLGQNHSVIITNDNFVYTAGLNNLGQLGRAVNFGTTESNSTFGVLIMSPYEMKPVDVACGNNHTVLQMANNQVITFGDNSNGQAPTQSGTVGSMKILGNVKDVMGVAAGTITTHLFYPQTNAKTIETLGVLKTFGQRTKVSSSGVTSAVINANNATNLLMAGSNSAGQLGMGNIANLSPSIQTVTNNGSLSGNVLKDIKVAGNINNPRFNYVTALDMSGQVHNWGYNNHNDLGYTNGGVAVTVPIRISTSGSLNGVTITQISSNASANLALDTLGRIHGWGNNSNNPLAFHNGVYPVIISTAGSLNGNTFTSVLVGGSTPASYALDTLGRIHSWGYSSNGALGSGSLGSYSTATPTIQMNGSLVGKTVIKLASVNAVGAMGCIDSDGNLHMWGFNAAYNLGDGTITDRALPYIVTRGNLLGVKIRDVSCGPESTYATSVNGDLYSWGSNSNGQLANNATFGGGPSNQLTLPIPTILTNVSVSYGFGGSMIASSYNNLNLNVSMIIAYDQTVFFAGSNTFGQQLTASAFATSGNLSAISGITSATYPIFVNFTGQHRCFVDGLNPYRLQNYEGMTVVSDKNKYLTLNGSNNITINECLPVVSLSSTQQDKRAFGVISIKPNETTVAETLTESDYAKLREEGDNRVEVNAIGEGAIWVADNNGALESGDYIHTSTIPGYCTKQADDILRNYTVAKVTMDCDFSDPQIEDQEIKKDSYGNNVLDSEGSIILDTIMTYSEELQQLVPKTRSFYKMRYLQLDGVEITKEEYTTRKANNENVYRAAFVGCTYHCG